MENEDEVQSQTTDEVEELDSFLAEDEKGSLSPEEIAEKKVQFYKNLLKKERLQKKDSVLAKKETVKPDFEARLSEQEQKVELRMAGYSVDEIREIEAYAKGKGVPLNEAEKSSFVKAAIENVRAQNKSKDAVLEPGNMNVMVGDKSASSVLSDPAATASAKQEAMDAMRSKMFRR